MTFRKIFISIFVLFLVIISSYADRITSFSFASDDFHQGCSFKASSSTSIAGEGELDLFVDLNEDNVGGLVKFHSIYKFEGWLSNYQVFNYNGGFLHVWTAEGFLEFRHLDPTTGDPVLLTIKFPKAVLTSWSSSVQYTGETLTLQDSEFADPDLRFYPDTLLVDIGVVPMSVEESEDFAITFTRIKTGNNMKFIPIDNNGRFLDEWTSEGSFSASAADH